MGGLGVGDEELLDGAGGLEFAGEATEEEGEGDEGEENVVAFDGIATEDKAALDELPVKAEEISAKSAFGEGDGLEQKDEAEPIVVEEDLAFV